MKYLELFITVLCSIVGIAIIGAYFDAITNSECALVLVGCLFVLVVAAQLPTNEAIN